MDYKINDIDLSTKEIEVTLAYDDIKKDIDTEIVKQTKTIQIPGFRKGKVPLTVLKKMFGNSLEVEASEKVANSHFWKLVKENDLKPIGQPQLSDIQFNPGQDLFFKVQYEVIPEIEVKDYTGNNIDIPDLQVQDDDVENEIKRIVRENSTKVDADAVGEGNNYFLKVTVTRVDENGAPFEGSLPETIDIDLSNPGISSEILENSKGKKTGESFNFSFTDKRKIKNAEGVEEEVSENFLYSAEILQIQEAVAPEFTEELVKKVSNDKASSEQELRDNIRAEIQAYYDSRTKEFINDRLFYTVIKNNDFNPPHSLVHSVLDDLVKNEEDKSKGAAKSKFDKNEAHKRLHPQAEIQAKWLIIKDAIKAKENLTVSDEELSELAAKDSEKIGIPVDKLLTYYKSANYSERLLDNKLFDFLKENNNINLKNPEELSKNQEEESK